jgi:hypothetical protein
MHLLWIEAMKINTSSLLPGPHSMKSNTTTVLTFCHPDVTLFKLTISNLTFGLALFLASNSLCCAQAIKLVSAQPGSTAFDIVENRNIFNQYRVQKVPPPEPLKPVYRVEPGYIACVGTMQYEQGSYVFFEGNRPAYTRVLSPSNSIAGWQVVAIEPNSVTLATVSNELCLPVGARIGQEPGGRWRLVGDAGNNFRNPQL